MYVCIAKTCTLGDRTIFRSREAAATLLTPEEAVAKRVMTLNKDGGLVSASRSHPATNRGGAQQLQMATHASFPDCNIRGSCEFFPKTAYPSHAAIRNVAVSLAFISLRTTRRFCPSRSASAMASCHSL